MSEQIQAQQPLPAKPVLAKLREEFSALTSTVDAKATDKVADINDVIAFLRKVFDKTCAETAKLGLPASYRRVSPAELHARGAMYSAPTSAIVGFLLKTNLGPLAEGINNTCLNTLKADEVYRNADWRLENYELDVIPMPTMESRSGVSHLVFIGGYVDAKGTAAPSREDIEDQRTKLLKDLTEAISKGVHSDAVAQSAPSQAQAAPAQSDTSDEVAALKAQLAAMQSSMVNFMEHVAAQAQAPAAPRAVSHKRKPGRPPKAKPTTSDE